MSATPQLREPQLFCEWMLPVGRDKFRLDEVAKIVSPDDGSEPVSERSIRNGLESGQLFGMRLNFAAKPGEEQRFRGMMTRADVLQFILATRTSQPADQLAQLMQIVSTLSPEALALLQGFITRTLQQKVRK